MSYAISKLLVAFVCLIFGVVSSLLFNSCDDSLAKANEIRAVIDKYHIALESQDEEVLNSILVDKLRIVTRFEDGFLSKSDFLERFHSLDGKLESIEVTNVRIEVGENKSTLECLAKMVLNSKQSGMLLHEAMYTYGLENIDGKWKINSIQQR